ncbi:MAG: triose-phosphate isomerase [Bacteroidia bacterium]|nr:triose-phosphate isomerase [Bacteroidia bacterium]
MRKFIIAGNWKMNLNIEEGYSLGSEINGMINDELNNSNVEIILIPPFIHIAGLLKIIDSSIISVGAQNCHYLNNGAYTGEISPKMLKDMGVKYVLIGHSERRQYNFETNELLAKKTVAAIENNLSPIYCIGETLEQREKKLEFNTNKTQLEEGLFHLTADNILKTVIAYEPVWAIGTGITATAEQANQMHAFIRKLIADKYSDKVAENVRILYGGSMKPENSNELLNCKDIDGGLIGGASLESRSFVNIAKTIPV